MKKILFLFLVVLCGCGTVGKALNPYDDAFTCPKTDPGRCVSVRTAYDEALKQGNDGGIKDQQSSDGDRELKKLIIDTKEKSSLNAYENIMFDRMANLLREPVTPIVAPPSVMRVLFLAYKGDNNELLMPRFIYFFADDPKWVMGDYIIGKETE